MNNFKDGGFNKNRGNFGGDRRGGGKFQGDKRSGGGFGSGRDRSDKPAQMFAASCSSCHKTCQVPFKPSGDKPVYCSDCFGKRQDDEKRGDRGGDRRDSRPQHNSAPVRAEHPNDRRRDADTELRKRLADIESKLNRILDLINPPMPRETRENVVQKAEKPAKKVVDTEALKQAVSAATTAAPAKKVAKKAAKKAPAKKIVKKVAKKAVKKAPAKKAAKKTK